MKPAPTPGISSPFDHEEVELEVYLKEKASGITLTNTPLLTDADEEALRSLFPEAWNSPEHECQVSGNDLENRLPRAVEAIAKSMGQSSTTPQVTERSKPYKEFVESVSQFESEGRTPVAVIHGIS